MKIEQKNIQQQNQQYAELAGRSVQGPSSNGMSVTDGGEIETTGLSRQPSVASDSLREPATTESLNNIQTAHALDWSTTQNQALYAQWSASYDNDVKNEGYVAPEYSAQIVDALMTELAKTNDSSAPTVIFDAGAGTGLFGSEVAKLGDTKSLVLDGADLSPDMAIKAEKTGAYRHMSGNFDINDAGCYPDKRYDIVASIGVFTPGHVKPASIGNMLNITKPGGYVLVSTREGYTKDEQLLSEINGLMQSNQAKLHSITMGPYIDQENAYYTVLQKPTE